jgi:hypothetical protein
MIRILNITFICIIFNLTGISQLKFRVVNDLNTGVKSSIIKISGKGNREDLGPTNDTGDYTVMAICAPGEKLQAVPLIKNTYLPSNESYCIDIKGVLKVYKIEYANTLKANAMDLELENNFSSAAYLYNELAVRYLSDDSLLSTSFKIKAYNLTAKQFKVKNVFDVSKGEDSSFTISTDMRKLIIKFQSKNGLPVDGKLSISTSLKLSNLNESETQSLLLIRRKREAKGL